MFLEASQLSCNKNETVSESPSCEYPPMLLLQLLKQRVSHT